MRKFLIIFLLLLPAYGRANDPWEPYYEDEYGLDASKKPKPHPHPIVPESSSYGAIFIASGLLLVTGYRWYYRRRA